MKTPLALPLGLFAASGLVGMWAAYDRAFAWYRFEILLIGIAISLLIASLNGVTNFLSLTKDTLTSVLIWTFLIASTLLSLYFVTQFDFSKLATKMPWISPIGTWLNALIPQFAFIPLYPNNIAGILELALPIGVALLWKNSLHRNGAFFLAIFIVVVLAFGMLMTASRAGWLALIIGGTMMALVAWMQHDSFSSKTNRRTLVVVTLILLAIALIALVSFRQLIWNWVEIFYATSDEYSRAELYRQTWRLIQDYVFTGSGLGTFPMVYSTYALLIHVFFLPHAHNIFLQIWIEQGLVGLVAFVWAIGTFYAWCWQQRHRLHWLAIGGIGATTVLLLHGFLDAPMWYANRTTALLFFPFAITAAALPPTPSWLGARNRKTNAVALGIAGLALLSMGTSWKTIAAMWSANLGSVSQTQVELSAYNFPDTLVEYVRRNKDLSTSEVYFERALALDPGNVTANQRLAQIALARAEFDTAFDYLEPAYQRDPNNPVTWQLIGAAYLGLGHLDQAYDFWSRLPNAAGKLESEAWVRYETRGDSERAHWAWQLAARFFTERGYR
jgi:O-antigen ligase